MLCAISKVGVLYCFAVHGSNLLWQVTKIIRHLQTLNSQIPLISVTTWVSFLIPVWEGMLVRLYIDTPNRCPGIIFNTRAARNVRCVCDIFTLYTPFIARVSFLIPVWVGMLKTLSVLYAKAYDAGRFGHKCKFRFER